MIMEYWFMLPVSVLIATVAMASGVEGATFFTPLFILSLGLPPEIAIGTGLITEVFGFGSGVLAYARKRLIDYRLSGMLLLFSLPMAIIGGWAAGWVAPAILKTILGTGLLVLAMAFLRAPAGEEIERLDRQISGNHSGEPDHRQLLTRDGEVIRYRVCNRSEGGLIAAVGGGFIGMISTGLGEMNGFFLLQRCRVPSRVAVATSVFVVALTALTASAGHFVRFVETGGDTLRTVLSLVIFTVPGVIVGGQLGLLVAGRLSQRTLEKSLAVLFLLVAVLMLGQVALKG